MKRFDQFNKQKNSRWYMGLATAFVSLAMAVTACSSAPKIDIPANANPQDEIVNLEAEVKSGYDNHLDVLAPDDFKASRDRLDDARDAVKDGDEQSTIIRKLSQSKGYLERAKNKAADRGDKLAGVLDARKNAIAAGAKKYPKEKSRLAEIDEDAMDEANDIKDMTPETFAQLQKDYQALQVQAIQSTQLGKARATIAAMENQKAAKRAPKTFKQAEQDMVNAENVIASNPNNPDGFSQSVRTANNSARFLAAVMAAVVRDGQVLPESAAIEIASKNYKIQEMNTELAESQSDLEESETLSENQRQKLSSQGESLDMNKRLNSVGKIFKKTDAEVYRQGEKVVIRLKGMKFNTASSSLPETSLALLAQVKTAVEKLGAGSVVVEGHTDSTGSAATNKQISQKRADIVAEYLKTSGTVEERVEAVGFGYEKPIATNKTKDGRAQNRRVDLIITPKVAKKSGDEKISTAE